MSELNLNLCVHRDSLSDRARCSVWRIADYLHENKHCRHVTAAILKNSFKDIKIEDIDYVLNYLSRKNVGILENKYELFIDGEDVPEPIEDGILEEYLETGDLYSPVNGDKISTDGLSYYFVRTDKLEGLHE